MADCGLSCNVSKTVVTFSPIEGDAPLWDDGDLVTYELDEVVTTEHTDHRGDNLIRSGKNVKMVEVTLTLFPCSAWYKALYNAWMEDSLICGDLVIDDPCCMIILVTKAGIKKFGLKPVSVESKPIEVVFRGILTAS